MNTNINPANGESLCTSQAKKLTPAQKNTLANILAHYYASWNNAKRQKCFNQRTLSILYRENLVKDGYRDMANCDTKVLLTDVGFKIASEELAKRYEETLSEHAIYALVKNYELMVDQQETSSTYHATFGNFARETECDCDAEIKVELSVFDYIKCDGSFYFLTERGVLAARKYLLGDESENEVANGESVCAPAPIKIRSFPTKVNIFDKDGTLLMSKLYPSENGASDEFERLTRGVSDLADNSDWGRFQIQVVRVHPEKGESVYRELFADDLPVDVFMSAPVEQEKPLPILCFAAVYKGKHTRLRTYTEKEARKQARIQLGGITEFYQTFPDDVDYSAYPEIQALKVADLGGAK